MILPMLILMIAGWIQRHQQQVIPYTTTQVTPRHTVGLVRQP
jgi:hypothetical protein